MDIERIYCKECSKENLERDCQCRGCGNICSDLFRREIALDVSKVEAIDQSYPEVINDEVPEKTDEVFDKAGEEEVEQVTDPSPSVKRNKFKAGTKRKKGLYTCISCNFTFKIEDKSGILPQCSRCNAGLWVKEAD